MRLRTVDRRGLLSVKGPRNVNRQSGTAISHSTIFLSLVTDLATARPTSFRRHSRLLVYRSRAAPSTRSEASTKLGEIVTDALPSPTNARITRYRIFRVASATTDYPLSVFTSFSRVLSFAGPILGSFGKKRALSTREQRGDRALRAIQRQPGDRCLANRGRNLPSESSRHGDYPRKSGSIIALSTDSRHNLRSTTATVVEDSAKKLRK